MKRAIVGGAAVTAIVLLAVVAGRWALQPRIRPIEAPSPAASIPSVTERDARGFLFGRISTVDGRTYQGRLRFGTDQEAFWGDYFNGTKDHNPWTRHVPPEGLPKSRTRFELWGITFAGPARDRDLVRPFMARFGDVARVEPHGDKVRVFMKSGTEFDLDRFGASDFDDGVRVWDEERGVVDLDSLRIRAIEFLPTPALRDVPMRLHGVVRTAHGEFAGFLQWDRQQCVGEDELHGRTAEGTLRLRFDAIRSIARRSHDQVLVTRVDGRNVELEVRHQGLGTYVDDPRYGRVLVSWDAIERVELDAAGSGPAYGEFTPGRPIDGRITTQAGGVLAGRLVFDLDESETTETLDARWQGVDYTLPLDLIASIALPHDAPHATVTLRNGEPLQLEFSGDLGDANAGMLVFPEGGGQPEYVPWGEVAQIDLGRPESEPP